ncbi:hypothetical protein HF086_011111 [Spodoptera exigua]|uniref:Ropporin-1-like protein n=1 Tax=Spodoptera exigua TaxID=7107 RepID=A0A922SNX3_SPOEX|nr:hypothetical protein HF086_011111 [Spodoptera exigua]
MPELIEQMYSSQQIVIPPKYPYILKRYCKAAIKTQPYDLLRWSFEYFKALAEHRPPPVKLRLEYPIYSTEGGLTRGCLKVLAHQLYGMSDIPLSTLKQAWNGFCLDSMELQRILCLCEVYHRQDDVPYLHFLAVAGGMLTKCLTHTMILLCESLTKEPDGGSAAIPVEEFLAIFLLISGTVQKGAGDNDRILTTKDNGPLIPGSAPEPEVEDEEVTQTEPTSEQPESDKEDDYWEGQDLQILPLIDDHVPRTARLSRKLKYLSITRMQESGMLDSGEPKEEIKETVSETEETEENAEEEEEEEAVTEELPPTPSPDQNDRERVKLFLSEIEQVRAERLSDIERTFDEIAALVDRYETANYDLG